MRVTIRTNVMIVEKLPLPAKRNVQADHLATESLQEQLHNQPAPFIPLLNCMAYLTHKGNFICAHKSTQLREILPGKDLLQYYKHRYKWSARTMNNINWELFTNLHKRKHTPRQFAIKLSTGWLATNGKIKQTQNPHHDAGCILCQQSESMTHMFQCPGRNEWCKEFLNKLRRLTTSIKTAPQVANDIALGLQQFLAPTTPFPNTWKTIRRRTLDGAIYFAASLPTGGKTATGNTMPDTTHPAKKQ